MKKKKNGTMVTVVIIILILIFAGLGVKTLADRYKNSLAAAAAAPAASAAVGAAPQNPGNQPPPGEARAGEGQAAEERTATTVRVTPVVRDTIENSVVINGDVLAANQVSIFPTVGGKITGTLFQVGDRVRAGAVVAMVDPSRPGQVYSESPVLSTISGTILQVPVHTGDTVSTQSAVCVVGDLSSLMIETFVPERFSNAARLGLSAQVSLEALPGETFTAVVDELSPVLDPVSRTLRIRLRFTEGESLSGEAPAGGSGRADPRIKAGMFATVSLVTNTRRDVPVIPRGAVINTYGSWIVFTVNDENIASRREITLGLENENFIEVTEGLLPGETIVSAGQNFLTDGDPVRIVD